MKNEHNNAPRMLTHNESRASVETLQQYKDNTYWDLHVPQMQIAWWSGHCAFSFVVTYDFTESFKNATVFFRLCVTTTCHSIKSNAVYLTAHNLGQSAYVELKWILAENQIQLNVWWGAFLRSSDRLWIRIFTRRISGNAAIAILAVMGVLHVRRERWGPQDNFALWKF